MQAQQPIRLLTLDNLVRYLLDNQIVSSADVVDDESFAVEDRTRRNRNFKVLRSGAPKLMVKQSGSFDPESVATLHAEANLLEAVANDGHFRPIRWFSPRLVYFDAANSILVTELVHPATSLTKFHLNQGKVGFAVEMGATAGRVLANFHTAATQAVRRGYIDFLRPGMPFAFKAQQFLSKAGDEAGEATAEFMALLKATPLYGNLAAIQETIAGGKEVVHGDVRWDNFLLTHGSAPATNMNVRLIDWELAHLGDSAWDVTCYLTEYLRFWLNTVSLVTKDPDTDAPEGAFRLEEAHGSAQRFLDAYFRRRNLRGAQRAAFLGRVGWYLPYAVVAVAFESTQRQSKVPFHAKVGLRMAQEAYADPHGRLAQWFGVRREA